MSSLLLMPHFHLIRGEVIFLIEGSKLPWQTERHLLEAQRGALHPDCGVLASRAGERPAPCRSGLGLSVATLGPQPSAMSVPGSLSWSWQTRARVSVELLWQHVNTECPAGNRMKICL